MSAYLHCERDLPPQGIVTVRLLKVWGLMAAGEDLSAFVRVTSTANKKEWRSSTRYWSRARHVSCCALD